MDGEERKSAAAVSDVAFGDRPIGSMVQSKSAENLNRVEIGLGETDMPENMVDDGSVLGGMEDAVSNLRDGGSDKVKVPDINLVELSDPLTGPVRDASLNANVVLSTLVTDCGIEEDGELFMTVAEGGAECSGFEEDRVMVPCGQGVQTSRADECCNSSGIIDDDRKLNCVQSVVGFSALGSSGSNEVQSLRDKVEEYSESMTNSVELPNLNFPSRGMEDSYKSAEDKFSNGTNLAAMSFSTADCKDFMVENEAGVPFMDEDSTISCKRSADRVSNESENGSQLGVSEENHFQPGLENRTEKPVSSSAFLQKEIAEILNKLPLPHSDDLSRGPSESEQDKLVPPNRKRVSKINGSTLSCDEMDGRLSPTNLENNEYVVVLPNSGSQGNNLSTSQRTTRKTKKRRHENMAYEGDADWDNLINERGFLGGHQGFESDRSMRRRDRLKSSSYLVTDVGDDGTIAVSVGLKAHAVGPAEKLKFKEVLKQKAGLQEYLKCRNHILHLWNKDMSRTLQLLDCGVADTPTDDEPPCASLIREIYTFLDSRGYINFGVALRKEKTEPLIKHSYKLIGEKPLEGNSGSSGVNSEDGVSFIIGQVRNSETSIEVKDDVEVEDENRLLESKEVKAFVDAARVQSLNPNEQEEINSNQNMEIECVNLDTPKQFVSSPKQFLSAPNADLSCESLDSGKIPVKAGEETDVLCNVPSVTDNQKGYNYQEQCDTKVRKNIIVVGAGPAGLTAARHLQRQGFSVTVLEARNRIGGRVYTDRSSLSVPVDLGASIITGVEADLATERRPDPSSLICAQLGLELTVLNSDCPLYDIVTGNKVPADLDEDLESEYNSLLDDMVLLVAHQGKKAMKMSLEDGLEYALRKRRMSRSASNIEEPGWKRSADTLCHSVKRSADGIGVEKICSERDILSSLERRVMNWHFAHLEYGCAALLKEVSLPHWNQDDAYGGFGGAHCMIKGGYSAIVESLGTGVSIQLNHIVTDVTYSNDSQDNGVHHNVVKVSTSNGREFVGDAVLITVPLGCLKAGAIKFSPSLPPWKHNSIQRLGFGVLNKVVLEFPEVFWDDSLDYFGATAQETDQRGHCFMFWNVRKTVGAPVLIALVVGKAARDGQNLNSSDHVNHALRVLRKLFGKASVPDPVASVVTDWGRDPFSYGAYSYVAIGASGEDYDLLARPVENCLFFAGEATCKEHPDTVGGAMISGLREAVRIIDILCTGTDHTAEMEVMEAVHRYSDCERDEVRDFITRLDAVKISNSLYKHSLEGTRLMSREALLKEMFFGAKTTAGRLVLAKELLKFPVGALKSFAGTKRGLGTLNSWILDSLGKDGTQLLRQCVRILVRVATDLLAVRLSGIGKTIKEKVCVHTSRDIRAIASQLTSVWLETFHKEKARGGLLRLLKQGSSVDSSRRKILKDSKLGNPHQQSHDGVQGDKAKDDCFISEEEKAAIVAAEKAHAAALAAAEAYKSSEAKCNSLQLPKIPSFHKFIRRERHAQTGETDPKRRSPGRILGRQDVNSDIRSRSCKVVDWSVKSSAGCVILDSLRNSGNNLPHQSHSNEHILEREHSGEGVGMSNNILAKAWVDSSGSAGIKDFQAIERWQSQAAAAAGGSDLSHPEMPIKHEEESITKIILFSSGHHGLPNEGLDSQVSVNKEPVKNRSRGSDRIKQAIVDFVGTLLMPLYKAKKIDKDGYKSIMKKTTTKVIEQATDAEKSMSVNEFLHYKRKSKIRDLVDIFIARHMGAESISKP